MAPFPPAPLRTARESFDLKPLSSDLGPRGPRTMVSAASALRISRTSQPLALRSPVPLPPVHGSPVRPGGASLPRVLWHSVTLGLAPRRQSRVPSLRNVLARRRRPTYALECVRYASPIEQGIPRAKLELVALDGVGLQTCYRRVCQFHRWTLGFRQSSFRPIAQALQGSLIHVF